MITLITLGVVCCLIAIRQIGNIRFQIWQIMLLGAFVVLVTGQISPSDAVSAIDIDVMLFLFGVFVIGRALEESGYLGYLSYRMYRRAGTPGKLVLLIILTMGFFSAFLMNDTLAIIGTPVVLSLAFKNNLRPKLLLLSLAFAVTIGSVMSPIGNPQNLLIGIHGGVDNPFITFFRYLFVPTVVNLLLAYLVLRLFYRGEFNTRPLTHEIAPIVDDKLAGLARWSLVLLAALIAVKMVTVFFSWGVDFELSYIAVAAALPVLLFSRKRFGIIRRVDWSTLVFFAAMFILMASVWNTGFFQEQMEALDLDFSSMGVIMGISVILSQLISNVPLVALYLPVLTGAGSTAPQLMALAAGSTIAGNLTILGAASNIIIIQNAEKNGGATLTFWDFVRVGAPLTVINVAVYTGWLYLIT